MISFLPNSFEEQISMIVLESISVALRLVTVGDRWVVPQNVGLRMTSQVYPDI